MAAGIALNKYLFFENVDTILKPGLQILLQTYLQLIYTIDHESLVEALQGIIGLF